MSYPNVGAIYKLFRGNPSDFCKTMKKKRENFLARSMLICVESMACRNRSATTLVPERTTTGGARMKTRGRADELGDDTDLSAFMSSDGHLGFFQGFGCELLDPGRVPARAADVAAASEGALFLTLKPAPLHALGTQLMAASNTADPMTQPLPHRRPAVPQGETRASGA